jgi:hypothetical protein
LAKLEQLSILCRPLNQLCQLVGYRINHYLFDLSSSPKTQEADVEDRYIANSLARTTDSRIIVPYFILPIQPLVSVSRQIAGVISLADL